MNRVRFAPSPTGFLHIGGARTYVFNWLFARSTGGQVVLRIDDTDIERNTDESLRSILDGLRWLDLPWDEQHAQSERFGSHKEAAQALLARGLAYRDFTPESSGGAPRDNRAPWLCNPGMRELSAAESERRAAAGEPFVTRFRVPRERPDGVGFKDLVLRKQFRKFADLDDFALLRSNGQPTYHLASTVDDGDLDITHVIRGQDHLTNTFKHLLLFDALGYERPQFGHLPLLLGPDGTKLSKRRHGSVVSVTRYRDMGFLPAGFVNYLSLLGWSPKDNREVLTVAELVAAFRIEHVLRTNAVVQFGERPGDAPMDPKAIWLTGQHLRGMPVDQLLPAAERELRAADCWLDDYAGSRRAWFSDAIDALRSRLNLLTELPVRCRAYFRDDFGIETKAQTNLDKEGVRELLRELARRVDAMEGFTEESAERALRGLAEERGVKAGLLINGSRAALTGQSVGPSAFRVFTLLGKRRVVERLRTV